MFLKREKSSNKNKYTREMKNDLSNLKVGDKCFSLQYGECVVTEIICGYINVYIDGMVHGYLQDGRYSLQDKYPTLFAERPEWHEDSHFESCPEIGDFCIFYSTSRDSHGRLNAVCGILTGIDKYSEEYKFKGTGNIKSIYCVKFESKEQYIELIEKTNYGSKL